MIGAVREVVPPRGDAAELDLVDNDPADVAGDAAGSRTSLLWPPPGKIKEARRSGPLCLPDRSASVLVTIVALIALGDIDASVRSAIAAHGAAGVLLLLLRRIGNGDTEQCTRTRAENCAGGVSADGLTNQRPTGRAQARASQCALILRGLRATGK